MHADTEPATRSSPQRQRTERETRTIVVGLGIVKELKESSWRQSLSSLKEGLAGEC